MYYFGTAADIVVNLTAALSISVGHTDFTTNLPVYSIYFCISANSSYEAVSKAFLIA